MYDRGTWLWLVIAQDIKIRTAINIELQQTAVYNAWNRPQMCNRLPSLHCT